MYCIHVLRIYIYIYIWVVYPVDFVSSSCKKGLLSIKGDGELGLSRSMEKSAFNRSLLRDCPRALLAHERSIVQKRISHDGILQKEWSKDIISTNEITWSYLNCPTIFSHECRLAPTFSKSPLNYRRRLRKVSDFFGVEECRLAWHLWETIRNNDF